MLQGGKLFNLLRENLLFRQWKLFWVMLSLDEPDVMSWKNETQHWTQRLHLLHGEILAVKCSPKFVSFVLMRMLCSFQWWTSRELLQSQGVTLRKLAEASQRKALQELIRKGSRSAPKERHVQSVFVEDIHLPDFVSNERELWKLK